MRQGLKAYSNWPTFPQLYANGRLVGGLDVVKELVEEGQLQKELGVDNAVTEKDEPDLITRIERKITTALQAVKVIVEDMSDGCGAKFNVVVVSSVFEGMREFVPPCFLSFSVRPDANSHARAAALIDRQRQVHEAIKDEMEKIHALTLKCKTPDQI